MKRIIVAMIAVCAFALHGDARDGAADDGQHPGAHRRRPEGRRAGCHRHGQERARPASRRTEVTDVEGIYRLNALPVGTYDVHAELSGFPPYDRKAIVVNVGTTIDLNIDLNVAGVSESVKVTAEIAADPDDELVGRRRRRRRSASRTCR